jgi:hypothetical protein
MRRGRPAKRSSVGGATKGHQCLVVKGFGTVEESTREYYTIKLILFYQKSTMSSRTDEASSRPDSQTARSRDI